MAKDKNEQFSFGDVKIEKRAELPEARRGRRTAKNPFIGAVEESMRSEDVSCFEIPSQHAKTAEVKLRSAANTCNARIKVRFTTEDGESIALKDVDSLEADTPVLVWFEAVDASEDV